MLISRSKSIALLFATSLVAIVAGCNQGSSSDDHVHARANVINKTTQASSALSLLSLKGTYGPQCQDNPSGQWEVDLTGQGTSTLEVLKNDIACELFVTGVGTLDNGDPALYATPSPQKLTDMYPNAQPYGDPIKFYATAKFSSALFAADFTIDLMYSDLLERLEQGNIAQHTIVKATGGNLTAHDSPDYAVDLATVNVQTNMYHRVFSRTGDVVFTPGTQPADSYVIVPNDILTDFATADAIWHSTPSPIAVGGQPNDPIAVPVSSLLQVDDSGTPENEATDLGDGPAIRSFIFHSVSAEGVHAYEIVKVGFLRYDTQN